ncbi:Rfa3p NDAI_0B00290 [Naumovozyma dairenensis CBS 421]|uniref:Replication factor A protein 3 n=1 Tax=Naumovozyma dairenensis (strain ATCC 10597 / BCRC 20456 / CBS 421 / NBRC 0211 / NRRL Y-12639) TaxID=1071378 RepID=G0W5K2_NAUDC|nr:hypothetical protein NDAI_0B00290 [Naumovozyma dairenensis CBS 421]CCD23063.1 hypothetical protein NDAI_0B00290 [Naumovozyma dairenensis CBS 421]
MASETPRLDPTEIANSNASVFRIIAQVKSQPTESTLILSSPSKGNEMITLSNVRLSMTRTPFQIDSWYEFVCRANDTGDVGFLILDSVPCILKENESISIDGIVALQQLTKKFPEIY